MAYANSGKQISNSGGDYEVYLMNALDGLGKKNLTNDAEHDFYPNWGVRVMCSPKTPAHADQQKGAH